MDWLGSLTTAGTLFFLGLGAYGTWILSDRDRHIRRHARKEREERLDEFLTAVNLDKWRATIDAVLGRPEDPTGFPPRVVPLADLIAQNNERVTMLKATVGNVNGSGKTLMEMMGETARELAAMGHGQKVLSHSMEDHLTADTARFAEMDVRLKEMEKRP